MSAVHLRTAVCLVGLTFLAGCTSTRSNTVSYRPPVPSRGAVVVVDGAGGAPEAYEAAIAGVKQARIPLYVASYEWTHGAGWGVSDMTDVEYSRKQAQCLAVKLAGFRSRNPDLPITILAYSAGTNVALEATRYMEPDSLERIILLAPAVSADYDLRQALRVSRQGVDAFTSRRDRFFLGLGTRIVGTADGKVGVPPAGRVGFDTPSDPVLATRLHQHPWETSLDWTDNPGNHSGTLQPRYFRAYVLPLLAASAR